MKNNESNKGEIVMYQPDETIRLEVRMGEETVWLTQQQMAELFDKDRTVIGRHIRNIYKEEELEKSITCAKFAHMGTDGDQEYEYTAYNLDVIISVGYRVKSKRGTKFRQWANGILKEYLLRGYVVNARIMALEQHVAEQDIQIKDLKNKVDFFVRSSLPPVEGIFYDGQLQLDIQRHNQQYPPIAVNYCQRNHDRFLIIDDVVYLFGASLKDAGKKLFAYIKMQETSASELLNNIR